MAQHLARVVRLDDSDLNVFHIAAEPGEWAISGAFEFANAEPDALVGKTRQAFSNGWLGLDSFARASIVAAAPVTDAELAAIVEALAAHFVMRYGAPDLAAARPVAAEEVRQMVDLCSEQAANTLFLVERSFDTVGIRERYRPVRPRDAPLTAFAVHGE